VHLAGEGKDWLNREFLWFCFFYPFEQLNVTKIIAPIDSNNRASIRWTEHCGFTLEATLKDACPKGDMLLYTMTREACKWLQLKDRYRGKAFSTGPA
jgi:RimJ/RimL family protein N-acetyltransferase